MRATQMSIENWYANYPGKTNEQHPIYIKVFTHV